MKFKYLILSCLIVFSLDSEHLQAQIIYGKNGYTEYRPGSLPIIISVPHDGKLSPTNIPDRTCSDPTLVTDLNTYKLGEQIDSSFFSLTGCHIHLIFCNLKRTKLDCNRNLEEGACGNKDAEEAWKEFQFFIDSAQTIAKKQYSGKAFYIDLHGHGHNLQRLELGYLYTSTQLSYSDSLLNSNLLKSYSSIQHLVATNKYGYSNAEMMRGKFALGSLLMNSGYPSVPSIQIPSPGNDPYFDGGYNTANHSSYKAGNTVNGVQIECNLSNVRDSYLNRKQFSDTLATLLLKYLNYHQNLTPLSCQTTETSITQTNAFPLHYFPNPAKDYIEFETTDLKVEYCIKLINPVGEVMLNLKNEHKMNLSHLPKGMYILHYSDSINRSSYSKLILQ